MACVQGKVVGHQGLETFPTFWRRRHVGYIGMAVRDDLQLQVYADNPAGVALYEKFGVEIEGTHRRFAFRDGEYVDAYSMARVRA